MICEHCGNILSDSARICDQCGAELRAAAPKKGAAGIRQGRPRREGASRAGSGGGLSSAPLASDAPLSERRRRRYEEDAGKPTTRRGVPERPSKGGKSVSTRQKTHHRRRHAVNWALLMTIAVFLIVCLAAGGYIYLQTTEEGQLIMARLGREADSNALWVYGGELLQQGYIERSIETYEKAYEMDPERDDIYDKLQLLAEAYEANGQPDKAEEIFVKLYTELDEKNPVAYTEVVRLMTAQGRLLELSDFLKFAYEKTGQSTFRRQREQMLPTTPTASVSGGRYEMTTDMENPVKTVELLSAEGYDIFYIFGEGDLPEDGTLYEGPIVLGEGIHVLRAVAVSSELISEEMEVRYTISLPTPMAPKASLAPATYERQQRVWLRYTDKDPVTIYYTIDGQDPSANSPIYTGDPIYLPGGYVTVKAVAVNKYGKVSNIMEVKYKINISFKRYFNESDEFSTFSIMKTTRDAFVKRYGDPLEETEIEDSAVPESCIKLSYTWGEARFYLTEKGYILYYVSTSSASMLGPRKTKIGMTEKALVELFRDMGQLPYQNGDRSLYWDEAEGFARINRIDDASSRVDYAYYRDDGSTVTASFYIENGSIARITLGCAF